MADLGPHAREAPGSVIFGGIGSFLGSFLYVCGA